MLAKFAEGNMWLDRFTRIFGRRSRNSANTPQQDSPKDVDELARRLCTEIVGEEEKILRLAAWIANHIANEEGRGKGINAALDERTGRCGVQSRLFVEMARAVGCEANVFSIFDRGMTHTIAQAKVGDHWCFVDPMYGVAFRGPDGLMDFETMRSDPDAAIAAKFLISEDPPVSEQPLVSLAEREAKADNLYAREKIASARSYGFLHSEIPVSFFPQVNLDPNELPISVDARESADGKSFTKDCSRVFRSPMLDTFGATNKRVQLVWEMSNAEPGRVYELELSLTPPKRKSLAIGAQAIGARVVENGRIEITAGDGPRTWSILFTPTSDAVTLRITPAQNTPWGRAATLTGLQVSVIDRHRSSDALGGSSSNDCATLLSARMDALADWEAVPTVEKLRSQLWQKSGLVRSIQNGSFYPYKMRPANWSLLEQGLAAIYGFRITGDQRFLEWISFVTGAVCKYRDSDTQAVDDFRQRSFPTWGARVKSVRDGETYWVAEACTGACMVLPAALAIWEARRSDGISTSLRRELDDLLPICRDVAECFEEDVVETEQGAYLVMPHDGNPEPFAHTAPYAALLTVLHSITSERRYLRRAKTFEACFRNSIQEDCGTWYWPYRPPQQEERMLGEHFFKARVTLLFPLVAHSVGLIFNSEDMLQFARTIDNFIVKDDGFLYLRIDPGSRCLDDGAIAKYAEKGRLGSYARVMSFFAFATWRPELGSKLIQVPQRYPELFPTDSLLSLPPDVCALRADPFRALRVDDVSGISER